MLAAATRTTSRAAPENDGAAAQAAPTASDEQTRTSGERVGQAAEVTPAVCGLKVG